MSSPGLDALTRDLESAVPDRPFSIRFWDGTELASSNGGGPTFTLHSSKALAHLVRAPSQLGLGRAYVSGEIDVDDIDAAIALIGAWKPPSLSMSDRARLVAKAVRAMGPTTLPRVPKSELRPSGRLHSPTRDARAVRHHYDVSNEFFALFLDETMSYSCAFFSRVARDGTPISDRLAAVPVGSGRGADLEPAQRAKLAVTSSKLGLKPGMRLLDVGCGWGSFVIHAAREHRVEAVGITLSEPQAVEARRRVAQEGLADRVDVRVMDYRELGAERFDAVASIGMVEHVGAARIDLYARRLYEMLIPGGRLLNHGIARLAPSAPAPGAFSERYVFPDGDPLPFSRVQLALERAGFVTEQVEGFAADYAETLRRWIERFDANLERARELADEERVRVWRLYLRAARNGFETGHTSIYQALCERPA